jgi:hypothetical protein
MNQALYAHMNNKRKMKKKLFFTSSLSLSGALGLPCISPAQSKELVISPGTPACFYWKLILNN